MTWKSFDQHNSYSEVLFIIVNTLKASAWITPPTHRWEKQGSVSLEVSWSLMERVHGPHVITQRGKKTELTSLLLTFWRGTQREGSVPPRKEGRARVVSSRTRRLLGLLVRMPVILTKRRILSPGSGAQHVLRPKPGTQSWWAPWLLRNVV